MFNRIKISSKITWLIIAMAAVSVVSICWFTYKINVNSLRDKLNTSVASAADQQAELLNNFFEHITTSSKFIASSEALLKSLSASPDTIATSLKSIQEIYSFKHVFLTDKRGTVLSSTNPEVEKGKGLDNLDVPFFERAAGEVSYSGIRKSKAGAKEEYYLYAASAIGDFVLLFQIDMAPINQKLSMPIGETGESLLVQVDPVSGKMIIVNPLRNDRGAYLKVINESDRSSKEVKLALEGKNGSSIGYDYRGKEVIAAYRKIAKNGWALVVKVDQQEWETAGNTLLLIYFIVGAVIIAFAWGGAVFFARSLTEPLNRMNHILSQVSHGILPENIESSTKDEFGEMSAQVNELVRTLKASAEFAKKVGEGKLDAPYQPAGDNDMLGMALLHMREDLIDNERKEKERNWIVRGMAEIAEILRAFDNVELLGDAVIKFISERIDAVQAVFYDVDRENDPPMIELKASFAYGRKKYLKKTFKFAEGLVGQAAAEKDYVMRTEIPDDYLSITSGLLGEQKPNCILIVPLITNEEVYGLLEFASMKRFTDSQVKFVQELSVILARTIFNIKVNERTRKLLTESQQLSNELQEKQEVLRQNAEEMQATQEELKRSNQMLEEQIEEVNSTQKRMQLLLENASEVITIYEEDGTIRYISPSVEAILGYGQKELQGKSDMYLIHPDGQVVAKKLFESLKKKPDEKVTVQFEYKTKDGNFIWLEATGTNFMSNKAIRGYILNSRDITERRRAEQEQRMRSKMQALSENSPDLITRLENEAISYINPTIKTYSGKAPDRFLNKKVKEAELNTSILDQWLAVVEQVNQSHDTVSMEMDFPSELGKRVMQVNAIPEYDEKDNIESVLVVSHDITERKEIELEIQNKNKKINDSINYAKRIQNAILPNSRLINKVLPDSFILYKPRDVVSGDFPWFVQIKNDIFIAAVDCTGHGVPGALLSLIGYFLLNDIVRSRKITEPGKILDLLDEGVTQTLRQDQDDSATKDGMDIALCRINMDSLTVEYAGAHRPLYYMKGGVMDEVKGNKFPIGGGIYKNQTNFTTTRLELSKGDSFYFSSDGFPDQFGGPEVRKFGPKKTREIIERVYKSSMNEAAEVFDQEWEAWKGDHKQTDDVLLIGIKF
jgi:PAS domain S-box-containing protein